MVVAYLHTFYIAHIPGDVCIERVRPGKHFLRDTGAGSDLYLIYKGMGG